MEKLKKTGFHKNFYNVEIPYGEELLLYNIINQNFVSLDREYAYLYNNLKELAKEENREKLQEFMDAGFIVEDTIDEKEAYIRNFHLSRWYSRRLLFTIVPTTACNFRCPYCFEQGIKPLILKKNIIEDSKQFIRERIEIFKPEEVHVAFYGGEPLLEVEKIIEMGRFFKSLSSERKFKLKSEIVTNGYLLTEEIARRLYNEAQVTSAQITLDGPPEIHDKRRPLQGAKPTFNVIYHNVESILAQDLDFTIRVRVNVDKTNIHALDELLGMLSELPNRKEKLEIYFSPVTGENDANAPIQDDTLFNEEEFGRVYVDTIIPLLYRHGFDFERYPEFSYVFCGGITPFHYIIDADGSIKKCYDLVGRNEESVGHVKNYTEDDKRVLRWELFEPLSEECLRCKYLPICGGGCPYKKMQTGKNVCEPWKYVLEDLLIKIYELKKLKEKGKG